MFVVKKKIILVGVLFSMLLILTGCGNKKALTTEEFTNLANENGFTISDATSQFTDSYVSKATLALKDGYQIEFYVIDNVENSKKMFEYNKNQFQNYKSGVSTELSKSVGNYSTYLLQSNGYYMYLSRIDNTLIYIRTDISYKEEVKSFVEKIGY